MLTITSGVNLLIKYERKTNKYTMAKRETLWIYLEQQEGVVLMRRCIKTMEIVGPRENNELIIYALIHTNSYQHTLIFLFLLWYLDNFFCHNKLSTGNRKYIRKCIRNYAGYHCYKLTRRLRNSIAFKLITVHYPYFYVDAPADIC